MSLLTETLPNQTNILFTNKTIYNIIIKRKLLKQKTIHLKSTNQKHSIPTLPEETVLKALVTHGVVIKQACTNGVCGVCLTPLLSGEIDYADKRPRGLNHKEIQDGYFLPCIATCKTDICIGQPKVKLR